MALSAVQCVIGIAVDAASNRAANFLFLAAVSACSAGTQDGSVDMVYLGSSASNALSDRFISPTTGAATGTLRSISFGSTSSCTNFTSGFHLPLPNESIQLMRAPITITASDCSMMVERHESALNSPLSGSTPFAIDIARYGNLYVSDSSFIKSSA